MQNKCWWIFWMDDFCSICLEGNLLKLSDSIPAIAFNSTLKYFWQVFQNINIQAFYYVLDNIVAWSKIDMKS